jgi:hypothetical protein
MIILERPAGLPGGIQVIGQAMPVGQLNMGCDFSGHMIPPNGARNPGVPNQN